MSFPNNGKACSNVTMTLQINCQTSHVLKVTEIGLESIKSGSPASILHHNCLNELLREITKTVIFKHKTALAYGKAHQILTGTMSGNNHT